MNNEPEAAFDKSDEEIMESDAPDEELEKGRGLDHVHGSYSIYQHRRIAGMYGLLRAGQR